jgi:type II protein arginine methyltransferase
MADSELSDLEIDVMVAGFEKNIAGRPDYARNLAGLAGLVLGRKKKLQACALARKAMAACDGESKDSDTRAEAALRAGRLLCTLLPGYHIPMMNDARRNSAWDRAFTKAVIPGMHALEIGTGAGMLALMAARAGAGLVTTCESDPIVAELAREVIALNGYSDRIHVLAKSSTELTPGVDLEEPAELLFCDIFADDMVCFDPLTAIAGVRGFLTPGAKVIPAGGAIQLALGNWSDYARFRADSAAGFNISPLTSFAKPQFSLPVGSRDLTVVSAGTEALVFDFCASEFPASGRVEVALEATVDATVNGIIQWIRLDLDDEIVLEARPAPGEGFYASLQFFPLARPVSLRRGERFWAVAEYRGDQLSVWPKG